MNLLSLVLPSPRLTLRPLHSGDQEAISRTFSADVRRQMSAGAAIKLEQVDAFVAGARRLLLKGTEWHAAIELKGGRVIGCFSMRGLDTPLPSLGLWIADEVQGEGYGKEAVMAVVTWAKANLSIEHLTYTCFADNERSVRAARSLAGFLAAKGEGLDPAGALRPTLEFWL